MEAGSTVSEGRREILPAIGGETNGSYFDASVRMNQENLAQKPAQPPQPRSHDANSTKTSISLRTKILKALPSRKQRSEEVGEQRSENGASHGDHHVPSTAEPVKAAQNLASPAGHSAGKLPQSSLVTATSAVQPAEKSTTQIATIDGMRIFNQEVDQSVEERFGEVCQSLEPALLDHLRKRRVEFRPLSLQLLVLGHDESDAAPWIVILCPKKAKLRIEQFLKKDFTRCICHGPEHCKIRFDIAVVDRPLRFTAGETVELVYVEQRDLGPSEIWTPRIKVLHSASAHYATMGGFVCVNEANGRKTIYGLTVGHILPPVGLCGDESCTSSDEDGDEDSDQDDTNNNLDYDGDLALSAETGNEDISDDGQTVVFSGRPRSNLESQTWTSLGKMSRMSYSSSARDRDWALVELDQIHDGSLDIPEAPLMQGHDMYQPETNRSAIIGSGALLPCSISKLSSRAILPSGQNFVNMHVLRLPGGKVPPAGSSGSWIIDAGPDRAVQVCGSLVAVDPFGSLWMVPMKDIISDVRKETKAKEIILAKSISIGSKTLPEPHGPSDIRQDTERLPSQLPGLGRMRTETPEEAKFINLAPSINLETPYFTRDGRRRKDPVVHNGGGQTYDPNTSTSAPNGAYFN